MNYSDFFVLGHGWATRYYWIKPIEYDIKKDEIEQIKKQKIIFGIQSGTTPGDIIGSSIAINFNSERFVNLLKENKIKSFKTYPIIFGSNYGIKMKYYHLELTNKVSEIVIEGISKKKYSVSINKEGKKAVLAQKGLYFNLKEWNGSDIFGIKDTLHIIVTKRLKELIKKAKLKNVVFTNVEDYSFGGYK